MYESEGTNTKDQKDLGEVEEGESRIVTVARSRSIATGREGGAQLSLAWDQIFAKANINVQKFALPL